MLFDCSSNKKMYTVNVTTAECIKNCNSSERSRLAIIIT